MSEKVIHGQETVAKASIDESSTAKASAERTSGDRSPGERAVAKQAVTGQTAAEKSKAEKAFSKEALLNSARWSGTDRLLLRRILKDGQFYTREQAAAQLKKIKAKVVG